MKVVSDAYYLTLYVFENLTTKVFSFFLSHNLKG